MKTKIIENKDEHKNKCRIQNNNKKINKIKNKNKHKKLTLR